MRKSKPKKRILLPDPKFHDVMVTRFVNNLMLQGKKSIAYSIFYDAIDMVGEKMKDSDKAPLDIWRKALENVTPQVEVKSRRVGGANFQVPTEVRPERKISLSMQLRRRCIQEKRRYAQNGRGQQGICTFPFLIPKEINNGKRS